MTGEETALRPCPCGKPGILATDEHTVKGTTYRVICSDWENCPLLCETDSHSTIEEAAAAWNTRPTENALLGRVVELEAKLAASYTPCRWTYDEDECSWDGSCGAKWYLDDGGPVENKMRFCPDCGHPLGQVKPKESPHAG